MKLPKPTEGSFEPAPAGNHLAVCYRLVDLGTQESPMYGAKHQILIGWELTDCMMDDGRPFVIGRRYTLSSHEKARLRHDLESWRGKRFEDRDFGPDGAFDIRNVIGVGCFLNVVHSDHDGKTYANIEAVAALPKGTPAPTLANSPVYLSLDQGEFDSDVFNGLSDRMRETIAASPEFQALQPRRKAGPVTVPQIDETDDNDSPF